MFLRALLGMILLVSPAAAVQVRSLAEDRLAGDPGFRLFLGTLQRAIGANDRDAVLRLVSYPLRVNDRPPDGSRRTHRTYRSAAAARADYNRIFTPAVRRVIMAQRYERLWGNSYGFMIGLGAVWFDRICLSRSCRPPRPVRIFAINPGAARVRPD